MTANYRTLLLTGLPRAGTTLCCHILNGCKNVLALHEPLSPCDFSSDETPEMALEIIGGFVARTRARIRNSGVALSRHRDGLVPDNPVSLETADSGLRALDVTQGLIDIGDRNLRPGFDLVVKHNALFTALLPDLLLAFPVYGIVRNPLAVLASWNTVDLPVNQGRIPAGEKFAPALKHQLDRTSDRVARQLLILEWFCQQYAEKLDSDSILRYEDFVANADVVPKTLGIRVSCSSPAGQRKSRNAAYDPELLRMLHHRLQGFGDAVWRFYSREDVAALYESSQR